MLMKVMMKVMVMVIMKVMVKEIMMKKMIIGVTVKYLAQAVTPSWNLTNLFCSLPHLSQEGSSRLATFRPLGWTRMRMTPTKMKLTQYLRAASCPWTLPSSRPGGRTASTWTLVSCWGCRCSLWCS